MKFYAFFTLVLFSLLLTCGVAAQQRDCNTIVLPAVNFDEDLLNDLPAEKMQEICNFSYNSFFVVDDTPEGAIVLDISDVVSVSDSMALKDDFVVDLSTLSLYAYNFEDFRFRYDNQIIYFRTPASSHRFLALRPYIQALRLTSGEETLSE